MPRQSKAIPQRVTCAVQKLNETAAPRCAPRPSDCSGNGLLIPKNHRRRQNQSNPQPGFPDKFLVFIYGTEKRQGLCNQTRSRAFGERIPYKAGWHTVGRADLDIIKQ